MKKNNLFLIFLISLFFSQISFGQNGFYQLTFEIPGGYTTTVSESSDLAADYFIRTDGTNISATYLGKEGSYYFAVQDKDNAPTPVPNPTFLDITSIDISGQTGLVFSVFLAEDDASDAAEDWDAGDYLHITYQIDATGYNNMIWVENDIGGTNGKPLIDTDFDGTGDGTEITSTFTEFIFSIPSTGSLLDIQFEFSGLAYGDEDIAIDNIRVGSVTSPLPVELTSFTAQAIDAGVLLNWTTATEVNNYGFEIEQASFREDGTTPVRTIPDERTTPVRTIPDERTTPVRTDWETIGFVEGHGNSNSPKEYSFSDYSASGNTNYRLKQIDTDGGFEYSYVITLIGSLGKTELYQNHPNPFNPSTKISFILAELSDVNISVYNMLGQKVAELLNNKMNAGTHNVEFDARSAGGGLSSGFYIYRLVTDSYGETPNYAKTMKMLLIK
ncbi:MAG: T9SS type A sorting domain-containing protein [Melioribacteraceae bacterium]|nr:T9SS type A sorting domain-containing protein [Melioribacteraceae bacterium]